MRLDREILTMAVVKEYLLISSSTIARAWDEMYVEVEGV